MFDFFYINQFVMRLFKNKKSVYRQTYDLATDEFVFTDRFESYRVPKTAVTDQFQINVDDYAEGAWLLLVKTKFDIRPSVGFPYRFPFQLAENNEGFPYYLPIKLG